MNVTLITRLSILHNIQMNPITSADLPYNKRVVGEVLSTAVEAAEHDTTDNN